MQRNVKSAFHEWCIRVALQLQLQLLPPIDMSSALVAPLRQVMSQN